MTRITQTKLMRKRREGGYYKPQPRETVTCKTCGLEKLLSVGQIWICKHK